MILSAALGQAPPPAQDGPRVRKFEVVYESTIADVPSGSKLLRAWLPMPRNEDGVQEVLSAAIAPIPNARITEAKDKGGDNRYWFVEMTDPPASVTLRATMQIRRKERINNKFDGAGVKRLTPEEREKLRDALLPNEKVPTSGAIEKLAAEVVPTGETNSVKAARTIYDHILGSMEYKKAGTGWGRGDTLWACENRYGNCTDFHSVFMSFARFHGIPVRFTMGLPLPPERGSGTIGGYHCWAEFYVTEIGWVPVDISEADKHPKLAEYYFGALTEDRVAFTRGRDLDLLPAPAAGRQNFFIYPIVEVDGKSLSDKRALSYKDLD
jgi:transglutaminase-like putative cysteine protease